jgi:multisubunit Na+/H+ antiporter MnhB subunit
VSGFAIALPGAVLGGLTDIAVFVLLPLLGFACAGFAAGLRRPDAPLSHGIVAAVVTVVAVQGLGIALVAAKGDTQHPAGWIANIGIAGGLGLIGAALSQRRAVAR